MVLGSNLEREYKKWAKAQGLITLKTSSANFIGLPDILTLTPSGGVVFSEFKGTKEKHTESQKVVMKALAERNIKVMWGVNTREKVEELKKLVLS